MTKNYTYTLKIIPHSKFIKNKLSHYEILFNKFTFDHVKFGKFNIQDIENSLVYLNMWSP